MFCGICPYHSNNTEKGQDQNADRYSRAERFKNICFRLAALWTVLIYDINLCFFIKCSPGQQWTRSISQSAFNDCANIPAPALVGSQWNRTSPLFCAFVIAQLLFCLKHVARDKLTVRHNRPTTIKWTLGFTRKVWFRHCNAHGSLARLVIQSFLSTRDSERLETGLCRTWCNAAESGGRVQ